jgi:queuine tRNA-ribosyltransferase
MVLDVCPPLPSPEPVVRQALERTAAWATRARRAHRREGQALFGIVQGGVDESMRRESARRTVEVGFDGYGIGGLSVGEARDEMLAALAAALEELPPDQPRYLMGVGDPAGLADAVGLGVDMFDCVRPSRLARHGTALTAAGPLRVRNSALAGDEASIDPSCACAVCARWSRGYLRHLLVVGEPSAARLLTIHNLAWTLALVGRLRQAVLDGRWAEVRAEVHATWAAAPSR